MRKLYATRLSALDEALRKHMPEETRWTRPEGGMCLWLELPPGFDASELLIHAKERGLLFAPAAISMCNRICRTRCAWASRI